MDLGLKGKRALITGGSKGIGAATGLALATEGCDVVLVSRTQAGLDATAARIRAQTGRKVDAFAADLSKGGEAERVAAAFPSVDILVNNAGDIPPGGLLEIDEARWRAAWELKVFGYINMSRLYYRAMRGRGGVIINVVGIVAQTREPEYLCLAVGNAAITTLTLSLGSDSHKDGVRVVGVSPGPVSTETILAYDRANPEAVSKRPFGRNATPEELAATIAFACSVPSAYLSGSIITVDGGMSARTQQS